MNGRIPKWKRALDITGSAFGLLALSPFFAVAGALIYLAYGRPVIFKQQRYGLHGKPFMIYKFQSMVPGAVEMQSSLKENNFRNGDVFKLKEDPRVTKFGRFIRKTSIDELPQLFNVLKGEMSLVGPRPLPIGEGPRDETVRKKRLEANPGITGLWQVTARDEPDFDRWADLDISYVEKQSLLLDIIILLKTIPAVLSGKGAW